MSHNRQILSQFPKTRPELPDGIKKIYEAHYKSNRQGGSKASSISQKMERWMHRQVASDTLRDFNGDTLEIGAGTLNQLDYERNFTNYDVVEPMPYLYEDSPHKDRIRHFYRDLQDIPETVRYDRITSIAVFEHICELPDVVARAAFLLKPEGHMLVAIPAEGSLPWYLGWRCTTGLEFYLKYRINYRHLMCFEHVNGWRDILSVLHCFFLKIKAKHFGFGPHLSFYHFYDCSTPDLKAAAFHIAEQSVHKN